MVDDKNLPRGGFIRGIIAGLLIVFFIFVGLAGIFPISEEIASRTPPAITLEKAVIEEVEEPQESVETISLPSEPADKLEIVEAPNAIETTEPEATIIESETAPVLSVSEIAPVQSATNIQVAEVDDEHPNVEMPDVPLVEAPKSISVPDADDETETPDVELSANSSNSETPLPVVEQVASIKAAEETDNAIPSEHSSLAKPVGGFEMTGQTIITSSANDVSEPSSVENTSSTDAFAEYRTEFVDNSPKSFLSLILFVDENTDATAISSLTFPFTIAIDSSSTSSSELIEGYRKAGYEILLQHTDEGGSYASSLVSSLRGVSGVIGVLDSPEGVLNRDANSLAATIEELSNTGHALVTAKALGLSRSFDLAKDAGIHAASVTANIDSSLGRVSTIRELDKIVLQASDGGVIVVYSEATSDFLSAMKYWVRSQKAMRVTLAPISASILRNQ